MNRNTTSSMDGIPADVKQKLDAQVLTPRPKSEKPEERESVQVADAKCQEIFYCKGRIRDTIPDVPNTLAPIDLQNALDETMNLGLADSTFKSNAYAWIVFYNQQNFNSIDILRVGDDLWNLDTPVFIEDERCRYKHIAQSDTRRLADIIKMFFEGDDWYGMANFRFNHELFELGY